MPLQQAITTGCRRARQLVGFSGSKSSSTAHRRFFLLGVIKHRCAACSTPPCRRARFFVAYDDTVPYIICSNVHYYES